MDGLKQRIVGALVIVSLAVIFLPMIFDKPHETSKKQLISIPIQPELPVITIDKPQKPVYKLVESNNEPKVIATSKSKVASEEPVSSQAEVDEKESKTIVKEEVKAKPVTQKTVQTKKAIDPVFNQDLLNNVWMVQLGTFGNHENAFKLRDKLRAKGYDGHTTKLNRDGKVLVRVFSGPYADKTKAAAIKKQIDKKFKAEKVNSLVVYFK